MLSSHYRAAFELLDAGLTDVQRTAAKVNHADWHSYNQNRFVLQ